MIQEFSSEDIAYMEKRGSDVNEVRLQFERFEKGFPFADIVRPATKDDGILALNDDQVAELVNDYDYSIAGKTVEKFVPASGAASRMFKDIYALLGDETGEKELQTAGIFLTNLERFPFFEALAEVMERDGLDIHAEAEKGNFKVIAKYLIEKDGLGYGDLPKGLLLFHRYEDETRTALEEHLAEAALYANNGSETSLHFTVSEHHLELFRKKVDELLPKYEEKYGLKYNVTYSTQAAGTDTLAASEDNEPFRDSDGNLLFRPGGHGALIHNLARRDADIIFVKNIDNVTKEELVADTVTYKKALASYLLKLQETQFHYLRLLEAGDVDPMTLCEIMDFAESQLMIPVNDQPTAEDLFALMNRPVRVCGMVKNEGEPGGGPFWVNNSANVCSLQIVESSQIDKNNPAKAEIMRKSTHFNPVDMVCAIKDYKGEKFNLTDFVDPDTGFISSKSYNGRTLKAMELPGLWNGAMADWITVFVEVPLSTFNPVKTVFDLLKRN